MSLLCVLTASPRTLADVHLLSRRMLAMRASADALLALCDLPDAFAAVMPEDEPLLRALQSAVMAADARAGRFLLLVRRRVWDDASRLYLGESQPISPVQTVSALLDRGQTQVSFAAASFSPASLAGQFSSVLFCPAGVSCAPDVLPRMSAALDESGLLAARVLPPLHDCAPLLTRLPDFYFSEGLAALRHRLARQNRALISDRVLLASAKAFSQLEKASSLDACPLWPEAAFVAEDTPSLQRSFRQTSRFFDALCRLPKLTGLQRLMLLAPMLRLFLLFLAAVTGLEFLAVLALLEPYALLHPRLLPAALVRAAELSGICPLARVREISRPAVLKLLDVGVQGLIVPNVKTLEQVQELVNYAKYYPIGQRGFCPSRKDGWGFDGLGSVPETMRHFNGETLLFPQCETAEALDIIEGICAVDGVDDLSISMGMPGQFDAPEFQAAITRIVAACRAAGKYCMFFTGTADGVIDGFRRGFDAMAYSLDAALFIQGVKRDVEDIRSRL